MSDTLHQRLAFRGFWAAEQLARRLPERAGSRLFRWAALGAHDLMPKKRAIVAGNQAQVLGRPPSDPLVAASTRRAFLLYGRYWHESFRAVDVPEAEIRRRVRASGAEHLEAALAAGRGAILAVPHMGNWDVAGRWLDVLGMPIVSVAERLEPERLFQLFLRHREALGMRIIGLESGSGVGRQLGRMLQDENAAVALVADRDLSGNGLEVQMFGRGRRIPLGPAALSLRTGAPLLPAGLYTLPQGWGVVICPPIAYEPTGDRRTDAEALTRALAREFEARISAAPADWHLFERGWPA